MVQELLDFSGFFFGVWGFFGFVGYEVCCFGFGV